MKKIRIGAGAGYSGERIEPALELAEKGQLDYIFFECLGERTVGIAQQEKLRNPERGYDPFLEARMLAILPVCHRNKTKIITNMGAANVKAAGDKVLEIARKLGLKDLVIATVTGDDVLEIVRHDGYTVAYTEVPITSLPGTLVSANAYIGAEPMVRALRMGADIVITGRVADPSLTLAAMAHAFDWSADDWPMLGKGTLVGHLLECCPHITGGYFADPPYKTVSDLAHIGFPLAEVFENGDAIITKVEGTGGEVTVPICIEQLLYELHDPAAYITPDVVADFSAVTLTQVGKDRVLVQGGTGRARTDTLKVSVGRIDGFIGEGQISYAGPGAKSRGQLALDIVRQRLQDIGLQSREMRYEMIGIDSTHGAAVSPQDGEPYEVRVRVAGRTDLLRDAERIGSEVETMFTSGPAGGGGAAKTTRPVLELVSVLMPRAMVTPEVHCQVVS
jgi:hypothetical protein